MPSMTQTEAEAFLAEPRVAMLGLEQADRAPLVVPLWYAYRRGGEIGLWMDGASYKVRLLARTPRLTLCVQDDTRRPYRYVSVEGRVARIAPIDFDTDLAPLVARYLDTEAAARYLDALGGAAGVRGDVYVRVTPVRWRAEVVGG